MASKIDADKTLMGLGDGVTNQQTNTEMGKESNVLFKSSFLLFSIDEGACPHRIKSQKTNKVVISLFC